MTDDLLSDEQLDALWATLGPTPTDADFARAAIKAHMDALAKPPLTAESEAEFVEWCRHNCSSGADGSAWYRTIWRAAWNAALSTLAKRGLEDLRDAVFEHLHKAIGYCGHCGKKTCAGKQSNSKLPESIPTRLLVEAFDAAATKGDSSALR